MIQAYEYLSLLTSFHLLSFFLPWQACGPSTLTSLSAIDAPSAFGWNWTFLMREKHVLEIKYVSRKQRCFWPDEQNIFLSVFEQQNVLSQNLSESSAISSRNPEKSNCRSFRHSPRFNCISLLLHQTGNFKRERRQTKGLSAEQLIYACIMYLCTFLTVHCMVPALQAIFLESRPWMFCGDNNFLCRQTHYWTATREPARIIQAMITVACWRWYAMRCLRVFVVSPINLFHSHNNIICRYKTMKSSPCFQMYPLHC